MTEYSVHDEPDFARTYDEDEMITLRRGDVRAVLDIATMSMDFGSGFLDNEQVEALRTLGAILGIEPMLVTPHNFVCQYKGRHAWEETDSGLPGYEWFCPICHHSSPTRPPDA